MLFLDRHEAGQRLSLSLSHLKGTSSIVLGLVRGGVVVAYEVAKALSLPLNVVIPKKVGAPYNPEFAMGAVAENGQKFIDSHIVKYLGLSKEEVERHVAMGQMELEAKVKRFRQKFPLPDLSGKTAILVDDGIATGATMRVSIDFARSMGAKRVVVAVPVGAADTVAIMDSLADEVVCLYSLMEFGSVGRFYTSFGQTEDEQVVSLLQLANVSSH